MAGNPAVVDISAGADVLSAVVFLAFLSSLPLLVTLLLLVPLFPCFTGLPAVVGVPLVDYSFLLKGGPYYCIAVADVFTVAGVPHDFWRLYCC